jgi:hypothetical protein
MSMSDDNMKRPLAESFRPKEDIGAPKAVRPTGGKPDPAPFDIGPIESYVTPPPKADGPKDGGKT